MGKFIVRTVPTGVKFVLRANNGEIVADSEVYNSEDACLKGVESVRRSSQGGVENQTVEGFETLVHPKYEIYLDKAGDYRFRLKAKNGQIVAASQAYKTLENCLTGVESVKTNAPDAEILRETAVAEVQ